MAGCYEGATRHSSISRSYEKVSCEGLLVSLGQEADLVSLDVCGVFKGPSVDHSILLCKEIRCGRSLWRRKVLC